MRLSILFFAFIIAGVFFTTFTSFVFGMTITNTYQYLDATDFEVVAPAELAVHNGEQVVGVNSSLGCGYEDPYGIFKPTGYVEVNFSTPIMYMYRLVLRAYSPNTLANSMWMWFNEGAWVVDDPANATYTRIEIGSSFPKTGNALITENSICMHIGATTTVNNSMRFYPREPGVMIAFVNMTMIPPPTILRAYSTCAGECDVDHPIPIRIETTGICKASDLDNQFGNIEVKGSGGTYTCDAANQQVDLAGTYYVDCIIPTSVTGGSGDITASLIWPEYSEMPSPQSNFAISVLQSEPNYLWAIAPAAVGAIVIAIVARYYYKKWAATKNAPREAGNFSAMFVSARRVTLLWEKAPVNTADALKLYDKIVREACDSFNCYIARKIGDSYLIVSKDPAQNIEASGEIQRQLRKINWYKVFTGQEAPPDVVAMANKRSKKNRNGTMPTASFQESKNRSYVSANGDEDEEGDIVFSQSENSLKMQSINSSDGSKHNTMKSGSGVDSSDPDVPGGVPFMDGNTRGTLVQRISPEANNSSRPSKPTSRRSFRDSQHPADSMRSGATNSSQRTRNVVETGIQCSIAIARGKGRIQSHEAGTVSEYETFEYSGDVVDEAASMVDLAHAGQVLTLEGVVQAVNGNKDNSSAAAAASSVSGTFTTLATKVIKTKSYKFAQYNPAGVEVLGCGLQDESDNIDSIQAQLDVASSGFAQKMCTILYIEFHGLIEQAEAEADDRKSFLEKYKSIYKPINDITKQLGGTLINITSSNLVIAFNAFSPSPMHVTRAATCYFRLRDLFTDEKLKQKFAIGKLAFCAGMSTGNCIVGTLESDKSHKQIFGSTWEQSQELMRMARGYAKAGELTCPCLAIWNSRSDLNHNTQFQFIDLVTSRRSAMPNQQQNNQGRILRGIVALMCPSDDNDDDREWMYDLEHQEGNNPYFQTNEAFTWLLGDFIGDAQERWTTILKPKLEKNANNEVAVNQMVGLKRLAEIFAESWEVFSANVSYNARL